MKKLLLLFLFITSRLIAGDRVFVIPMADLEKWSSGVTAHVAYPRFGPPAAMGSPNRIEKA